MHLTDTSINHKQHKWSITISPSQLARLTIHWWKAHKSCTPLTSGTPFSFEDFTDSMKTLCRHCAQEGPFMQFQLLGSHQSSFVCQLPCTAQSLLGKVCMQEHTYVCMYVCMWLYSQTRDPRTGWNRVHQEERSELSDQVQGSGRKSLPYLCPQSPFFSMFFP